MTDSEKRCPTCHRKVNRVTSVLPAPRLPEPGDFIVCMNCGELLKITKAVDVILADPTEIPIQRLMEYRMIRDKIRAKRAPHN